LYDPWLLVALNGADVGRFFGAKLSCSIQSMFTDVGLVLLWRKSERRIPCVCSLLHRFKKKFLTSLSEVVQYMMLVLFHRGLHRPRTQRMGDLMKNFVRIFDLLRLPAATETQNFKVASRFIVLASVPMVCETLI
jgi:hypothetical protein